VCAAFLGVRGIVLKVALVALMLVSALALAAEPPTITVTVERFEVEGDNPLDPVETAAALAPFAGDYAGIDGLLAATDALDQALRRAGYTFHRAILPPQELAGGVVVLKVVTFGMAEVEVRGMQHFSDASVRRSLPGLVAGTTPDIRRLSRSLAVANLHPHKRLKLGFKASEELPNAVDALVSVTDQKPWNAFASLNNIGNKDTGRLRMSVGGLYSNLTGHDDVLTGSFTFSPDNIDDLRQYGGFYQLPLYFAGGWLSAFYVRSDVDVGNVQDFFDVSGAGEFLGVAYKHQLIGVGRYRHTFTGGVQDRLFDTGLSTALTGTPIPGLSTKVRSRPLSLRYDGGYNWRTTSLDFYFDFTQNLSFGGHNRLADYRAVRLPADPGWKVVRFGALATQRLPRNYLAVGRLTGQYTNEPLIPGEQLGVGGERTVRGFEERTIAADKGLILNLEAWSPPFAELYGVRFLAFFDIGHKVLEEPLAGQRHNDTISSIGVGARWQWHNQLTAALDYGQPLANADGEAADRGNSKWHFTLQYRY
jgi:hemolysin activation/secretion protein